MLIPLLARAASSSRTRLPPGLLFSATRSFASTPLHRKDVHGRRPPIAAAPAPKPAALAVPAPPTAPLLEADNVLSSKQQRRADWAIIKEMSKYLWPKDNRGTRLRVGLSVGLLVGAKLLNVQVPFYFKNIVDAMNIDFAALGGTASTVAGSMIVACKLHHLCTHALPPGQH